MRKAALIFAMFVARLSSGFLYGQEIKVAAAADLQFAMQDIANRFQKESGKVVSVTYGSSGNFSQQIQNGAPFDVFFSANVDYPKQLEAAGLTEPGTLYPYAVGKIVLWVPNGSKVDISSGLSSLVDPAIRKIAMANPEHAPYGKAAVAALQKENVYEKVKGKIVLGENISQAATFAVSGAADAGILALSLAVSPNMKDKGHFVEVPEGAYPPLEQACVVLRASKQKDLARQFVDFIRSPAIRDLLLSYGFRPASTSQN